MISNLLVSYRSSTGLEVCDFAALLLLRIPQVCLSKKRLTRRVYSADLRADLDKSSQSEGGPLVIYLQSELLNNCKCRIAVYVETFNMCIPRYFQGDRSPADGEDHPASSLQRFAEAYYS